MKEENKSVDAGKLIAGLALAILLVVGGFALYVNSNAPTEAPIAGCADGGLSQEQCVRSCVAIVDLNNEVLLKAKRVDSEEKAMLKKRAFENCLQACEAVQSRE